MLFQSWKSIFKIKRNESGGIPNSSYIINPSNFLGSHHRTAGESKSPGENTAYLQLREAEYRYLITKRFGTKEFDIPVQLLRLGRRLLVGLPFEILTDFGQKLRAACPEALIVSMTGGYEDYLPLAADFEKGGYETESEANFLPDTGDRILAECIRKIRDFASSSKNN